MRPLIHGATYFARLHEELTALKAGDRVWFTDWRGDADERLLADGPSIGEVLAGLARAGVEVRGLVWRSHGERVSAPISGRSNELLSRQVNDAGGEVLLDQRVRLFGSHHQKLFVIRHRDNPSRDVAFVGGIDLSHTRRDDADHAGDPQAVSMDSRYGKRPPWHDATLELRGPVVADVLAVFAERWNDPHPLDRRTPYRMLLQRLARMPRHPEPLPASCAAAATGGPSLRAAAAHLRGETSSVPVRARGGTQHCPRLCESLRPRPLADLHRGPVPVVDRGRNRNCGGPRTEPRIERDRRRAPLPRLRRCLSQGRLSGSGNCVPSGCCAGSRRTGSACSTWRTAPELRSTSTPRSASSTTPGSPAAQTTSTADPGPTTASSPAPYSTPLLTTGKLPAQTRPRRFPAVGPRAPAPTLGRTPWPGPGRSPAPRPGGRAQALEHHRRRSRPMARNRAPLAPPHRTRAPPHPRARVVPPTSLGGSDEPPRRGPGRPPPPAAWHYRVLGKTLTAANQQNA